MRARPFYYLDNFRSALAWLKCRYADLLATDELAFIDLMAHLPTQSAALLVRMIMRRGQLFRTSKLQYPEIGPVESVAALLAEAGWIDMRPTLSLQQLCGLLRKQELQVALSLRRQPRLADWEGSHQLTLNLGLEDDVRPYERWWRNAPDSVFKVLVAELCGRLRLMFFGNFHQDWSEFVLSDLGIHRYEDVQFDKAERAFQRREQIEHFCALHRARELLDTNALPADVLQAMPPPLADADWIATRRAELLFRIGQRNEKALEMSSALAAYESCALPEARLRAIRVLERMGRIEEAAQMLGDTDTGTASEFERQHGARIRPRILRRLGRPSSRVKASATWASFDLALDAPEPRQSVERLVRDHLNAENTRVFYVENALINSLFGLQFWNAIFAPVAGAFFHPFHSGPVDLLDSEFRARRAAEFAIGFADLERGEHYATVLMNFERKAGIRSPFVAWGLITRDLLTTALACIPAVHLHACFERLLADLRANRTGLPDLVQFWPDERRYRLIEVKGPGDRLQDNQIRWLSFCAAREIPVHVCNVSWASR